MPLGLGLMMGLGHNVAASGGGGGGGFTPASITGLKFWGDADQQTDGADNPVATFTDRSGNSNDFTAAGGQQPTLRHASINGKKTLEFNGTVNVLVDSASGLMNGATEGAYFVVGKLNADPPASGAALLGGFSTSGSATEFPFTDGNVYEGFGRTTRPNCGNPTPSLASTFLVIVVSKTNDYRIYVNDTSTPFYSTGTNTVGFGTATRYIGYDGDGLLAGLVAEVGIASTAFSSTDITNIKNYVNTKFGTSF
jgi:hypothetical protein